jgi:hypothetical protein
MSIIKDERLDERRNILEIEDDEGDDHVSDNTIQQENKEAYNFYAVNDLFAESSEEENIDQLAEDY